MSYQKIWIMVERKSVASIFNLSPVINGTVYMKERINVGSKMAPTKTNIHRSNCCEAAIVTRVLVDFPDDWCIGTGECPYQMMYLTRN